jgi:hypothetical protein
MRDWCLEICRLRSASRVGPRPEELSPSRLARQERRLEKERADREAESKRGLIYAMNHLMRVVEGSRMARYSLARETQLDSP